ncbi:MAG: cobalamin-dependent protein [Candidatus Omnitrophica bacterium]|nr:cobalamin-dependent protein [Candidatus Omnitrophota bacterium]
MKVLLISSNISATPYSVYPLGLSMVAKFLVLAGHQVELFDFLESNCSLEVLGEKVKYARPELIGISIRNIDNVNFLNEQRYISIVKDIVAKIKKVSPRPVVLGGSGFSIMPREILEEVGADYGIIGEGEVAMVDFVNNAAKDIYPKERLINASHRLAGGRIPSAHYDQRLMDFYLKSGNVASLQTKRGCGHRCVYCTYPLLEGTNIRPRNPKDVVGDIEVLVNEHKAKYIFFTDSVFNDDEGYYLDVVSQMKARKINTPWCAFFKPDGLDSETILLMKQTGLKAAEMGADAASDIALKQLGKGFLFEDVIRTNELFNSHGVATAHYFMFGCPGERKETIYQGIENIKNLKKTVSFIFMGIRILPGTKLYDLALKQKIISDGQNLLDSAYYITPGIDKRWLEQTLTDAFSGIRHCVFPPDALDNSLQFLHKLGYSGSLWNMLIPGAAKRNRKKHAESR